MKVFFDLACMSTCCWWLPKTKYQPFIAHIRGTLNNHELCTDTETCEMFCFHRFILSQGRGNITLFKISNSDEKRVEWRRHWYFCYSLCKTTANLWGVLMVPQLTPKKHSSLMIEVMWVWICMLSIYRVTEDFPRIHRPYSASLLIRILH